MKILIIEDHYKFVTALIDALSEDEAGENSGVMITATADAKVAMKLLEQRWDWILIDHDLPDRWSGWQLLNNTMFFRSEDHARIIAISAIHENNVRLIRHGAHYMVNKMDNGFLDIVVDMIKNKRKEDV